MGKARGAARAGAARFPQPISSRADAVRATSGHPCSAMTQLTLGQAVLVVSSAGAAWLMVRAGSAKKLLTMRSPTRCASCGRRLTGKTCSCARP
jgi:hypothetical protein